MNRLLRARRIGVTVATIVIFAGALTGCNPLIQTPTELDPNLPMVTMEEVATHSTRTDAWIVVDEVAYDITDYISRHPGGDVFAYGEDNSQLYHAEHGNDVSRLAPFGVGYVTRG